MEIKVWVLVLTLKIKMQECSNKGIVRLFLKKVQYLDQIKQISRSNNNKKKKRRISKK